MNDKLNSDDLKKKIRFWAKELGFNAIGISDTKLQAQKKTRVTLHYLSRDV